ncbi:MAG: hypothetical protein AAFO69_03320 [Bacteroidota bacterium]
MKNCYLFFAFVIVIACDDTSSSKKTNEFNEQQRQQVEEFSNRLVISINGFDFSVVNSSWSNTAFKARMSQINKAQKAVLSHFSDELGQDIKYGNLSLIHEVNDGRGKVSQISLNYFGGYSELTLLKNFDSYFGFLKYRIEIENDRPVLTDYFDFVANAWYSEKIVQMLQLNSDYDAYSVERHHANTAIAARNAALEKGDTLAALQHLYQVPKTHELGIDLSLMKLELAAMLNDSIYANVLQTEYEQNQSLYLQYLHSYYFDTLSLPDVYQSLAHLLQVEGVLDSLAVTGKTWN